MTKIWPSISAAIAHSAHRAQAPLAWDPSSHLLSRFCFGASASQRSYIEARGGANWAAKYGDGWFNQQIALGAKLRGYAGDAHVAAQGPLLSKTPYDVVQYLAAHGNQYGWTAMDQLAEVTLGLQAFSPAQLYETLVDFFSNHLNVPNHNGDVWNTRHAFDRDVIRRYAMGSFTDMLLASAKHPAMLIYLNIAQSTKNAPNENYGRELLELHTVGLHYTQADVTNAARMLTGRTVDGNQHYLFDDYIHPTGKIKVLGFQHANTSAAAGEAAGDSLLRYLARHQYTATHLAQKLCMRFVSDAPSATLVTAVANAYLANGTQIVPMIRTIVRSDEFWQSRGLKVRRPVENMIATIRALGAPVADYGKALSTMHWQANSLGNLPLDWPAPNGYPDVAAAWRSAGSLLTQWNLQLGFAGGWWEGFGAYDPTTLYRTKPTTSGQAIDLLTRRLTGMTFSAGHRAALQSFLGEPASTAMAKSTLRWNLYPLVALILHGPHHAFR